MQMTTSDALDVNKESEAPREAYGLNEPATASYGKRCLMARRLAERGRSLQAAKSWKFQEVWLPKLTRSKQFNFLRSVRDRS